MKLSELIRRATRRNKVSRAVGAAVSALEPMEVRSYFTFAAPIASPGTAGTADMVAVDLNHDGKLDTVTSSTNGTITALIGNGDGTFQAPLVTALGAIPTSGFSGTQSGTLTASDLNGDGIVDVTALSSTRAVTLLGNGDGTFHLPISSPIGSSGTRISSGDVNGDGKADLAVANSTGSVTVMIGNGDGSFAAPVAYTAGPATEDVKIADMNHDGKNDLVVSDAISAGGVSVLLGNGDGTFQASKNFYAYSAPYRMNVDDYNHDGNEDVAVANSYTSSSVTILYGNGDGTLQPPQIYGTGGQPWEMESADINGDGYDDIVSSNGSTYQVNLNNGDGTFALPYSTPGTGVAFASGDYNGDGANDLVGANLSGVGVLINQAPAATNVSTAVGFAISAAGTTAAGAPLPVTVTAVDASGNAVTDFLGTVHIATSDPKMRGLTFSFVAGDAGVHQVLSGLSLYTAGTQTLSVAGPGGLTGGPVSVSVAAGVATRFGVSAPSNAVAGIATSFTVNATDNYGNADPTYVGTVHFTSSDAQASLPADYTFTADDAGTHTFSATLKTSGAKDITAIDTANLYANGRTAAINVAAAAAQSISMIGGGGHIGASHAVLVTAVDAFGNVATGYTGSAHLASSNAATQVGADAAFVNGVATVYITQTTLGAETLTATSASMSASETIVGTPGDAVSFVVSKLPGGVAGTTQSMTVTAYDAFGNVAVDYTGTVVFGSSDFYATLPGYTYSAADAGTHTFSVMMRTAGTQNVTTYDLAKPSMSSTQTGIVITAAAARTISVTPLKGVVAGTAQNVTVTARDAFGNIATGYTGTVKFATSDTLATLPASYTFTAADAGSKTISITYKSASGQDFTATDSVNATMTYYQRDIMITPAAMSGFAFRTPSNVSAGTAFALTLSAVDAFGNTVTGYTGKVHFTGPSGSTLPADYQFSAADAGSHVFNITFANTGTATLNVTDLLDNKLKASTSVTVKTATSTGGGNTGGGGTTTGGGGGGGGGGGSGGGKKVV